MRWNKGMTIAAAVVGSILILWSGKSEQPPSGWEPMQLGTEKPTIQQESTGVQSAALGQGQSQSQSEASSDAGRKPSNHDSALVEQNQVDAAVVHETNLNATGNNPDVSKGTTANQSDTPDRASSNKQAMVSAEASDNGKIDVNTATASKLTELPGIGEKKAQAIVDYRNAHGPFTRVSDLTKVKGIGTKMLEKMAPYVQIR
ncbi:ComEA family DNA-binding protein [Paenibacillus sp. QZ-Y1]|uniref:ComEA family DNA-binding protein n=1 Tax=Paenibacillus sp. QZ-Y1 TaxID=3414511 RepID=UPI003F79C29C